MRSARPAARFVLRARPAAQVAAARVLGFSLPVVACRAASSGEVAALWQGPDELLLLAPEADGEALAAALTDALAGVPHSLVDVGHRQMGFVLDGPFAAEALSSGCPLDLDISAFPVGMCTRTVFDKAEIVLWRQAPESWRLEVWRSFAAYVTGKLWEAAREFEPAG